MCLIKTPQDFRVESTTTTNPYHTKQAAGFLMRKQGCAVASKEIRLERLSTKRATNSLLYRKKPTRERNKK
ncbi:hypothetical protein [Helicobacter zhangjianzhongii]|uniref:hypothetical protein n=1 Tax=Helicobacter zhangjianzhongii TaxID=2974574 RepID=UPI0025526743|nr:hypothetical protein [Helicobacter sp. CPD2-1]MDL0079388.1 hypothetical protein [Helicobacter sp. CPD2-1]